MEDYSTKGAYAARDTATPGPPRVSHSLSGVVDKVEVLHDRLNDLAGFVHGQPPSTGVNGINAMPTVMGVGVESVVRHINERLNEALDRLNSYLQIL